MGGTAGFTQKKLFFVSSLKKGGYFLTVHVNGLLEGEKTVSSRQEAKEWLGRKGLKSKAAELLLDQADEETE